MISTQNKQSLTPATVEQIRNRTFQSTDNQQVIPQVTYNKVQNQYKLDHNIEDKQVQKEKTFYQQSVTINKPLQEFQQLNCHLPSKDSSDNQYTTQKEFDFPDFVNQPDKTKLSYLVFNPQLTTDIRVNVKPDINQILTFDNQSIKKEEVATILYSYPEDFPYKLVNNVQIYASQKNNNSTKKIQQIDGTMMKLLNENYCSQNEAQINKRKTRSNQETILQTPYNQFQMQIKDLTTNPKFYIEKKQDLLKQSIHKIDQYIEGDQSFQGQYSFDVTIDDKQIKQDLKPFTLNSKDLNGQTDIKQTVYGQIKYQYRIVSYYKQIDDEHAVFGFGIIFDDKFTQNDKTQLINKIEINSIQFTNKNGSQDFYNINLVDDNIFEMNEEFLIVSTEFPISINGTKPYINLKDDQPITLSKPEQKNIPLSDLRLFNVKFIKQLEDKSIINTQLEQVQSLFYFYDQTLSETTLRDIISSTVVVIDSNQKLQLVLSSQTVQNGVVQSYQRSSDFGYTTDITNPGFTDILEKRQSPQFVKLYHNEINTSKEEHGIVDFVLPINCFMSKRENAFPANYFDKQNLEFQINYRNQTELLDFFNTCLIMKNGEVLINKVQVSSILQISAFRSQITYDLVKTPQICLTRSFYVRNYIKTQNPVVQQLYQPSPSYNLIAMHFLGVDENTLNLYYRQNKVIKHSGDYTFNYDPSLYIQKRTTQLQYLLENQQYKQYPIWSVSQTLLDDESKLVIDKTIDSAESFWMTDKYIKPQYDNYISIIYPTNYMDKDQLPSMILSRNVKQTIQFKGLCQNFISILEFPTLIKYSRQNQTNDIQNNLTIDVKPNENLMMNTSM